MTYVLRNSHFSNKETAFSGPWVVWSLFGAPGEKKRENQMFLYSPVGGKKTAGLFVSPQKQSFGKGEMARSANGVVHK